MQRLLLFLRSPLLLLEWLRKLRPVVGRRANSVSLFAKVPKVAKTSWHALTDVLETPVLWQLTSHAVQVGIATGRVASVTNPMFGGRMAILFVHFKFYILGLIANGFACSLAPLLCSQNLA